MKLVILLLLSTISLFFCKQQETEVVTGDTAIIPLPVQLQTQPGFFTIDSQTAIKSDSFPNTPFDPWKIFMQVFKKKSGYSIPIEQNKISNTDEQHLILVIHSPEITNPEGYSLKVSPGSIVIKASTESGVYYAVQTLRQMMRLDAIGDVARNERSWKIPAVDIKDEPSFHYRGLHLDVCRHIMPLEFVLKYIDLLSYYKMNRFHWHLTDDQGWRIEIKQYPKLQEIAAWRDQTLIGHAGDTTKKFDGQRHGGYFTQEQVKQVVAYAADRNVMVIPEIEMPGHAQAAIAAYPELGCTNKQIKVAETWGVFYDVFCPNEVTFTFLQNVLDEVMPLFPGPYIHIGGDECPKKQWKESAFCQQLMKEQGLENANELQSYFIRRMEKYVNSKGKNIIGWDEILEGGLAPNATVMSWQGEKGGIAAAKLGHDVIMTPGTYCYLDHYQADKTKEPLAIGGFTTLEETYSYHPVPAELTSEEAKHILGVQGNLWTEYIHTPSHAEYMAYPRAMALAEVGWTPKPLRTFSSFQDRLNQQVDRLDGLQVNYARHYIK